MSTFSLKNKTFKSDLPCGNIDFSIKNMKNTKIPKLTQNKKFKNLKSRVILEFLIS